MPETAEQRALKLYKACQERFLSEPGAYFTQEDLESYGAIPKKEIGNAVNNLMGSKLLRPYTLDNTAVFKFRPSDIAKKLNSSSSEDENRVYEAIEDSGTNGLWAKILKTKTDIHQAALNKAIKSLETKKLIKLIVNVKAPAKKVYLLSHLDANEEVSGGSFYDNGELDTGMIYEIMRLITTWVQLRSWQITKQAVPLEERPEDPEELKRKQEAIHANGGGSRGSKFRPPAPMRTVALPLPPSYSDYPTTDQILVALNDSHVFTSMELSKHDLQMLLDAMIWEGKLELITDETYRVMRPALLKNGAQLLWDEGDIEDIGNGFTRAPCSRCPVFNLCEEGGPVSATNCEYFERWLRPQQNKMMEEDGFLMTEALKAKVDAQIAAMRKKEAGEA